MGARLAVTREQVLAYRRRVTALEERLPMGGASLRQGARAGLADSAPRAALLCLHARVKDVRPDTWEHESLVQLWSPRFSIYVRGRGRPGGVHARTDLRPRRAPSTR